MIQLVTSSAGAVAEPEYPSASTSIASSAEHAPMRGSTERPSSCPSGGPGATPFGAAAAHCGVLCSGVSVWSGESGAWSGEEEEERERASAWEMQ